MFKKILFTILLFCMLLGGCSKESVNEGIQPTEALVEKEVTSMPGPTIEVTSTPMPTSTLTPTVTPSPTVTPTPTATPTPTPTPVVLMDLELVSSGYSIEVREDYSLVYYAVEMHNPNMEHAVEFPTIELVARSESGAILGTEDQVLSAIAAGDTYKYGNSFMVEGDIPAVVEISLASPDDYDFIRQDRSEFIYVSSLVVSNTSEVESDYKKTYTGEVTNNSEYDYSSIAVTVIFKRGNEIVGGGTGYVDKVKAGKTKAFEVSSYSKSLEYDSFEIFALPW